MIDPGCLVHDWEMETTASKSVDDVEFPTVKGSNDPKDWVWVNAFRPDVADGLE